MSVTFKFRKEKTPLFGLIHRPLAQLYFWSEKGHYWAEIWALVDTGADYTLLPRFLAEDLQIDLEKEAEIHETVGVGGSKTVYFLPKIKVKLGDWEREIPVGFLDSNEIPPLMGRQLFFETFEVRFSKKHTISFEG